MGFAVTAVLTGDGSTRLVALTEFRVKVSASGHAASLDGECSKAFRVLELCHPIKVIKVPGASPRAYRPQRIQPFAGALTEPS